MKRGSSSQTTGAKAVKKKKARKTVESSSDEMELDTVCSCDAAVAKLTNEVGQLRNTVNELKAQVEFLMSALGWTLPQSTQSTPPSGSTTGDSSSAGEPTTGPSGTSSDRGSASQLQYSDAVRRPTNLQRTMRDNLVAAVYIDQKKKDSRAANIVVSGLPPQTRVADQTAVTDLCQDELGIVPDIVHCKRFGKEIAGKIQPLLVVLRSTDQADRILMQAKNLRNSSHDVIKSNVYINKHMTAAQSRAAYELRCQRRLTTRKQESKDQKQQPGSNISSQESAAAMAAAGDPGCNIRAAEFVMPPAAAAAASLVATAST